MSTRESHRRRARRHRSAVARASVPPEVVQVAHTCTSQCDNCHTLDNCVEATRQYGDLLLCEACRSKYPAKQPWVIDAESGEYVDNVVWIGRGRSK